MGKFACENSNTYFIFESPATRWVKNCKLRGWLLKRCQNPHSIGRPIMIIRFYTWFAFHFFILIKTKFWQILTIVHIIENENFNESMDKLTYCKQAVGATLSTTSHITSSLSRIIGLNCALSANLNISWWRRDVRVDREA